MKKISSDILNLHEDLLGDINRFHNKFGFKREGLLVQHRCKNKELYDVHILALLCFMPTAIIFSPVGVYIAHKMNKFTLRKAFAILLIFASFNLFVEWLKIS